MIGGTYIVMVSSTYTWKMVLLSVLAISVCQEHCPGRRHDIGESQLGTRSILSKKSYNISVGISLPLPIETCRPHIIYLICFCGVHFRFNIMTNLVSINNIRKNKKNSEQMETVLTFLIVLLSTPRYIQIN